MVSVPGICQIVIPVHRGHEVREVRKGLLGGEVGQVLDAHVLRGMAFAVKSGSGRKVILNFQAASSFWAGASVTRWVDDIFISGH